ncbi:hypothetical protein [Pseudomonas phage vB_PaeM_RP7]|nr:MAG: hypothetical protein [Pseudomonas phage RP4]WAB56864.1 hypothetical protein [Pseudomonas phage vB_PaeM_RP15]WAB56980.1 hypothetical protein [Pseudomonas phage vB_PaeM_RP6]WAB57111.1 hypothetical protein [Pseudomonas phage vB_PaeM_RP7]WAB57248.1 hypothetical protein [Pseudomonas phage vB_PaeM_RP8]WAB57490.1 hypothetical protein [Pseudomonas phage vB_PaeM_RP9]WAB57607.1 hypothetical protein [Pseudomonas phage vB_PaeM_RP10]WAB57893.1 hypothetical protein [Pseudomonas phage vB_PaeM_RP11]
MVTSFYSVAIIMTLGRVLRTVTITGELWPC